MAKRLEEDVAFRMLAAGNFPKHRTLCEFRRRHLADFRAVFAEVVVLARASGLVGLGRVSVDGTRVRANASKRKVMSYRRMVQEESRLEAEIGVQVERAEATDEAEDEHFGEGARGDEPPVGLKRREDRMAAIRAAEARLEAEQKSGGRRDEPQAGAGAQPEGRSSLQAGGKYGELDEMAQSNFTDPESRILKTSSEGFQRATTRRWRSTAKTSLWSRPG